MAIPKVKREKLITVLDAIYELSLKQVDQGSKLDPIIARRAKVRFKEFMKELGIDSPAKGLTIAVQFAGTGFLDWLSELSKYMTPVGDPSTKVDELRIIFGVYSNNFIDVPNFNDENIGRLTVLLWPYKNGRPARDPDDNNNLIQPYDLGGLYP